MYISKLSDLKKVGDKVIMRHEETEGRQGALNLLGTSLVQVRKMLELISNKVTTYRYHCVSRDTLYVTLHIVCHVYVPLEISSPPKPLLPPVFPTPCPPIVTPL